MRKGFVFATALAGTVYGLALTATQAQSNDLTKKFEAAAEFSSMTRDDFFGRRNDAGFGGRLTYNINRHVAIEGAGYFFPSLCSSCESNGRVTEGLFGVKAGKRFQRWGIFAKGRPGLISFSQGKFIYMQTGATGIF